MIGSFNFNNIESSVFKLVCKSVKRPLLPGVKLRRVNLTGSSGSYDFKKNEYELRQITMRIAYLGTDYNELRSRARSIAAWLGTDDWARLVIHDEPTLYYMAKVTAETDLQSLWELGTVDVVFDCQPFAMSIVEEVLQYTPSISTPYVFTNPGTRRIDCKSPPYSKSRITITGSWSTLSLTMNGTSTLTYKDAGTGPLVIDNIELEASVNGVNKFDSLDSDIDTFLPIQPGVNSLTISGTGLSGITVKMEYIPLWL